jgi:hypothetical protein
VSTATIKTITSIPLPLQRELVVVLSDLILTEEVVFNRWLAAVMLARIPHDADLADACHASIVEELRCLAQRDLNQTSAKGSKPVTVTPDLFMTIQAMAPFMNVRTHYHSLMLLVSFFLSLHPEHIRSPAFVNCKRHFMSIWSFP